MKPGLTPTPDKLCALNVCQSIMLNIIRTIKETLFWSIVSCNLDGGNVYSRRPTNANQTIRRYTSEDGIYHVFGRGSLKYYIDRGNQINL